MDSGYHRQIKKNTEDYIKKIMHEGSLNTIIIKRGRRFRITDVTYSEKHRQATAPLWVQEISNTTTKMETLCIHVFSSKGSNVIY